MNLICSLIFTMSALDALLSNWMSMTTPMITEVQLHEIAVHSSCSRPTVVYVGCLLKYLQSILFFLCDQRSFAQLLPLLVLPLPNQMSFLTSSMIPHTDMNTTFTLDSKREPIMSCCQHITVCMLSHIISYIISYLSSYILHSIT